MSDLEALREGKEAPPRGVRAMAFVRWALLVAVALAACFTVYGAAASRTGGDPAHAPAPRFYCPMHPEITSDTAGECPICHMTLEPVPEDRRRTTSAGPPAGGAAPKAPSRSASAGKGAAPALSAETAPFALAFDRVQAIGVRTEPVQVEGGNLPLVAPAAVEAPERSAAEVHVRAAGFIESTAVREVGARVHRGQPLATIYSPEVLRAEEELLAVADWKRAPSDGARAVDDARRRLDLLGVPASVVDRVVEKREAVRAIAITSPIDGYVSARTAVLGAYVTPEQSLFDIVGLDRVYVVASVEPAVLSRIHVGDAARFTTPSVPGHVFDAKIDLVYPTIDPFARAARVRFVLANRDQTLRPGVVGSAEFSEARAEEITVPLDAVVDTGRAAYVFVAQGGGRFEPRPVELGGERGDRVAVRGNLKDGERVVSRATFLIDAESRLRSSFAATSGDRMPSPGGPAGGAGGAP